MSLKPPARKFSGKDRPPKVGDCFIIRGTKHHLAQLWVKPGGRVAANVKAGTFGTVISLTNAAVKRDSAEDECNPFNFPKGFAYVLMADTGAVGWINVGWLRVV